MADPKQTTEIARLTTAARVAAARNDAWRAGWSTGHQVGWEHCQDGNYGTDYWDDETHVPPCPAPASTEEADRG